MNDGIITTSYKFANGERTMGKSVSERSAIPFSIGSS